MRGAGERVGCRGLPGCSIMRAFLPFANIGVLCAAARSPCICSRLRVALRFAQQPTGLTLPCGARMVSLPSQISAFCALAAHSPCICSRLQVALGLWPKCPPGSRFLSAHLQVALGLRPKCPQGTRFPARLPGFGADSRSLNRRGGRWPRPPLVSLPTSRSLWASGPTAHRADAPLRCPKNLCRSTKRERCERPKGARNAACCTFPKVP